MIVGRVEGEPALDEKTGTVRFPALVRTDDLDPTRAFFFRQFEIRLVPPLPSLAVETIAGEMGVAADGAVMLPGKKGRVLELANGRIVRRR